MYKSIFICIIFIASFVNSLLAQEKSILLKKGKLNRIESFNSQYVSSRKVDIWLPDGYSVNKKYAVIYMHDGQNLFSTKFSDGKEEWEVDETVAQLVKYNRIKDCIVVGIWNSGKRQREYQPTKVFNLLPDSIGKKLYAEFHGKPLGDDYLKFITLELKPFVDTHYSTLSEKENTYMIGASMGALISLYAICEYPDVFGSVACMSTHWPVSLKYQYAAIEEAYQKYLLEHLPSNLEHKIYFDYGTKTLDSLYGPYQLKIDKLMHEKWPTGHWTTIKFVEDEHAELFWQRRLNTPIEFLLGS